MSYSAFLAELFARRRMGMVFGTDRVVSALERLGLLPVPWKATVRRGAVMVGGAGDCGGCGGASGVGGGSGGGGLSGEGGW